MKQEDKDLLLKDLCARLPYDVKCKIEMWKGCDICTIYNINSIGYVEIVEDSDTNGVNIERIKPYLFPLSSMTEEQKQELFFNYIHNDIYFDDFTDYFLAGELWHDICVSMDALPLLINWLNKNRFDIYGLIPKGLAIDATGLNIY